MSEPAVRVRQPIDLEEFERRLRSGSPAAKPSGDPLAELARLVGQDDPFKRAFAKPALGRDTAVPDQTAPHLQLIQPVFARSDPRESEPLGHENYESFAPDLGNAHGEHDYAEPEVEAGDHYAYAAPDDVQAEEAEAQFAIEPQAEFPDEAYHFNMADDSDAHAVRDAAIAASALAAEGAMPRRSVRGVILLIAILSAGTAGFWAAVHAKGSVMAFATGGRQPPVILAGGPTKVQLPSVAVADASHDSASVLDKGASDASAKAKVVSSEELPVDLSQQPNPGPVMASAGPDPAVPRPAPAAVDPTPVAALRPVTDPQATAAPSPSPAVPATAGPVADASQPAVASPEMLSGRNGFPVPKRVKVVPVRPDGTFIGSDAPSASAAVADVAAKPAASAPQPDAASQPDTSPKTIAQAFAATAPLSPIAPADAAPDDPVKPAHKPRPGRSDKASAKPKTQVASDAAVPGDAATPIVPRPRADTAAAPKKPKATQVADAADSDSAATTSAGHFAVQLAASPSEQDARDNLQRFTRKYSAELGSHRTTFHRVQVGDKTVYRVRVGNLSHDEATQLCTKLQSSGGSCFVAAQN